MLTKRNGGLTEFIPTPQEKRDGLIRNHVLELVGLLHERLCLIEEASGINPESAERCRHLLDRIRAEECQISDINRRLSAHGIQNMEGADFLRYRQAATELESLTSRGDKAYPQRETAPTPLQGQS